MVCVCVRVACLFVSGGEGVTIFPSVFVHVYGSMGE